MPVFSRVAARLAVPSSLPAGDPFIIPAEFLVFCVLFRALFGSDGKVVQPGTGRAPLDQNSESGSMTPMNTPDDDITSY
jgi:hypothetical protein